MKTTWVRVCVLVLSAAAVPRRTDAAAATKYRPCALLTAAEVEATLGRKVDLSEENDQTISAGTWKGETMSTCNWLSKPSVQTSLHVIRGPRSPEERAAGLAPILEALEKLRRQGWTVDQVDIGGTRCLVGGSTASAQLQGSYLGCGTESKGLALWLQFASGAAPGASPAPLGVTPPQAKVLVEKAAGRLP